MTINLAQLRTVTTRQLAQYESACGEVQLEEQALTEVHQDLQDTQAAQEIIQHLAQEIQQQACGRIAALATNCLRAVFEREAYAVKIDFRRLRGKTEAEVYFARGGHRIVPLMASGGGPVDVASFALRLAAVLLSRPPLRRILCLDEPFRFVSENYRPAVRVLLERLATEQVTQIIMITHDRELACGDIIELE